MQQHQGIRKVFMMHVIIKINKFTQEEDYLGNSCRSLYYYIKH